MELTHGSLFTGIGGFDEGAEAAGVRSAWTAENNPFCNRYLKKRFPNAKQYGDVRAITAGAGVERTNVISAGFPCQNISCAQGVKGHGLYGAQSSLFFEVIRIASFLLPDYIILENSPELLGPSGDMWDIFGALTKIGYMCEWQCLRASDFGYPHKRERVYVIAYPIGERPQGPVFQPIGSFNLSTKWTSTEAYLRVSTEAALSERDCGPVSINDGFPGFRDVIRSYGNAVMPVAGEYIFRCILRNF